MRDYDLALHRLNHLNLFYAGAISELANGQASPAFLPMSHPGLKRTRDLLQLVIIARAELNAMTALLVRKGVFTTAEYVAQIIEEADWLANGKAEQFSREDGIRYTVTDAGIHFDARRPPQ